MFRSASRPFASLPGTRSARAARYFHWITTDFITFDARGNLVTREVPVVIGNLGESYVLIEREVGIALRAASPFTSASAASAEDRFKLTFFQDSQHFGFGSSSYPRLYVPNQMPRRTETNRSPATLFLDGKMHELVLDGTPDGIIQSQILPVLWILIHNADLATFAEYANATARTLAGALTQLEDM
ncbi:hypothetical protein N7491_009538 [Penicillium cf. griseofulvum]|uniref:Uncharacterized protein n=1 Tax=Penicillium cf. griseofulvum TaxID=2972120 RepID=A0A9W9JMP0_9EURO|nr:hypothetical protein N7472_004868 [Penicillium cf. griseofulvum]KAJ5424322.1 hypothetical protein N7491_009538 [Penicillium cf. griseofulvum]KAJ5442436.1 hypothetical protein N7445_005443 [Penicillium cf. griseofulvum]